MLHGVQTAMRNYSEIVQFGISMKRVSHQCSPDSQLRAIRNHLPRHHHPAAQCSTTSSSERAAACKNAGCCHFVCRAARETVYCREVLEQLDPTRVRPQDLD